VCVCVCVCVYVRARVRACTLPMSGCMVGARSVRERVREGAYIWIGMIRGWANPELGGVGQKVH
jgi:hypothetical protein